MIIILIVMITTISLLRIVAVSVGECSWLLLLFFVGCSVCLFSSWIQEVADFLVVVVMKMARLKVLFWLCAVVCCVLDVNRGESTCHISFISHPLIQW